jgi:hypothetical protein
MRPLLIGGAVAALLAVTSPGANAVFPYCTVITDPVGDVRLVGVDQTAGQVDDDNVDLRAVDVVATDRVMVVMFEATKLDPRRDGEWRLAFTSKRQQAFVVAQVRGLGRASTFYAGLKNRATLPVTGSVDYDASRVIVSFPTDVLGPARPTRGTALADFAAETVELVGSTNVLDAVVVHPALSDAGSSGGTYRAGSVCG